MAELTIQQLITLKVIIISLCVFVFFPTLLLFVIYFQETFNMLFVQCCRALQTDDNMIRNINAMQVPIYTTDPALY